MPRDCSICTSPQVTAMMAEIAGGVSIRTTATKWGVSRDALGRHMRHATAPAAPTDAGLRDEDPGRRALAAYSAALDALDRAEGAGSEPLILSAIRTARMAAATLAQAFGSRTASPDDRGRLESLYARSVGVVERTRGKGFLELAALRALKDLLNDLHQAVGDAGELVRVYTVLSDGRRAGGYRAPGEKDYGLWPARLVPEGGIIIKWNEGASRPDRKPLLGRALPHEEPAGNGDGHGG